MLNADKASPEGAPVGTIEERVAKAIDSAPDIIVIDAVQVARMEGDVAIPIMAFASSQMAADYAERLSGELRAKAAIEAMGEPPSEALDAIAALDYAGWDSYSGQPIKPETVTAARAILKALQQAQIAPCGDGSICFEIDIGHERSIWIDVKPEGDILAEVLHVEARNG